MSFYTCSDDDQLGVLFVTFVHDKSLLPSFSPHPDSVPAQNGNHFKKCKLILSLYFITYASYDVC